MEHREGGSAGIRTGWEVKSLGEMLEIQNGYAFDSKCFNPTTGLPLIRIRSLKSGTETETYYNGNYDEKYVVHCGDLLIGMDGEFGCYEWKGEPALLNQRVCRLRNFSDDLDPKFLFYGVNTHLKAIEDVTGFATVKHLSSKQILSIEFPLPPLAEQQRIVAILDEAFEGIATARKHAEQNLQNAKALFESHLEAVFSQKGEGWVEKSLETVGSILIGYSFNSSDFSCNEGTRCIKITNVGVREFVSTSDGFLPDSFSDDFAKVSVKEGSIVIALTRTIIADGLKVAVVPKEYDGALLNQRFASITVNENEVSTAFLFAYLTSQRVVDYVKAHVNTLMQPNLSIADLRSLPTPTPPRQYQDKTTVMLDALRDETNRLTDIYTQKIAALDALNKSLLHQAFSGEL